ncbi:hypothetical protein OEA41_006467 [Lepraria neglecta]|uniref:Uncharacterized protein n=1 Tax=Lepraria neglecta TaxID=209136 RepID=A0AAD9ZBM6_9LECA|nr:hypothetical protein OEA41_006467 [Lepraria neglecta]
MLGSSASSTDLDARCEQVVLQFQNEAARSSRLLSKFDKEKKEVSSLSQELAMIGSGPEAQEAVIHAEATLAGCFVVEELGESYLSNDDSSEDGSSEDGSSGGYFSETETRLRADVGGYFVWLEHRLGETVLELLCLALFCMVTKVC